MMSAPHTLASDTYRLMLTPSGAGEARRGELQLNRWHGDTLEDDLGLFIYLRDAKSGAFWSIGRQPVPDADGTECGHAFGEGFACFVKRGHGIEACMTVWVDGDRELRRIRLKNLGEKSRRIELTSYLEPVLHHPAADAGHPAFAKLFVQTEAVMEHAALLARRRPRGADERFPWLVHGLLGAQISGFETDRMRFIGRGRSLAAPRAMLDAGLSGTAGNVLDPCMALRTQIELAPGQEADALFVLGVAEDREAALALLAEPVGASLRPDVALARIHPPAALARPATQEGACTLPPHHSAELLQFENSYGGFNADGSEYVIRLPREADGTLKRPPLPWSNVLANAHNAGCIVSESGAIHSFAQNSREHRLTPWFNDPVIDPHGEAFYLRDEDAGLYWSPTPGPVAGAGDYEVRHGLGYTRFTHISQDLEQHTTVFVPLHETCRIVSIKLRNLSDRTRHLSVFNYNRLVLGVDPKGTAPHLETAWDMDAHALIARNPSAVAFADGTAYAALLSPAAAVHHSADRAAFIGQGRSPARPLALEQTETLDGRTGKGLDCAALQACITLEPGDERTLTFVLGETRDAAGLADLLRKLRQPGTVDALLAQLQTFWKDFTGKARIHTGKPDVDILVNHWLPYQTLVCRIWARTAYYQSGGAFGFRDQLQDALNLIRHDSQITRRQILLHAANQFVEGDVLHWWHPFPDGTSRGIRTRFSDDLLWLPYATAKYIQHTGDQAILDESVRYLTGPLLEEGEDERFMVPEDSGAQGDLYEHCCRALDRSLKVGVHGLPLMGTGDWNDGMNRVGRLGVGESVWVGMFLYAILGDFIPLCEARRDLARAEKYRAHRAKLLQAMNTEGWDGEWYRRAWYDNGAVLGSKDSDECQIDTLAQAWAVLSGTARGERIEQVLKAMEERLIDKNVGIIRLLTPAFDQTPHDPGYIKGYVAGVRENGGQYTHAALWAVMAFAQAGHKDKALELLAMLSPIRHTATPAGAERYMAEPYVIAADVYGVEPHNGRGGWTWYTGSAGWMLTAAALIGH
ncbi:MAG: GH36-type glycosyl hydrolase domain-containing protein [Halothiobacillaceae bacterium]